MEEMTAWRRGDHYALQATTTAGAVSVVSTDYIDVVAPVITQVCPPGEMSRGGRHGLSATHAGTARYDITFVPTAAIVTADSPQPLHGAAGVIARTYGSHLARLDTRRQQ